MPIFRSTGCILLYTVVSTVKERKALVGLGPSYSLCYVVISAEHHTQQYTTCTPEDGHLSARNMYR
jgi:hypothetical protein